MIKNDIDENTIEEIYPGVIDILLVDRTTRKNIIFASENYSYMIESPREVEIEGVTKKYI